MARKPTQVTHDLRALSNGASDKWSTNLTLSSRGKVTWMDADPQMLLAAVAAVTEDGAALLFSRTSDGGALALTVLVDGAAHKLYPASVAELREALQLLVKIGI